MDILRTPEECFEGLVSCPFEPRYTTADGIRMHHLEAGPPSGPPVVLLHGELSWSYSYRHVIPLLASEGMRAMAPDLVGFGRSDKPARPETYTCSGHVAWVGSWLKEQDLEGITLVCQGLGTLIGLRLVAQMPTKFSSVVVSGGFLPAGDRPLGTAFGLWDLASRYWPFFSFGWAVQAGCQRKLSSEERAAYDAPFPTTSHAAGARILSKIVPARRDEPEAGDNRRAWSVLVDWDRPFFTAYGEKDRFSNGADEVLRQRVPGASGREHASLPAAYFVSEDAPEELAGVVLRAARAGRAV